MTRFVICALAAAVLAIAAADSPPATLGTFAGFWSGHTRGLQITRTGLAKEHINDGCCRRVIDIRYRLSRPRGTASEATVRARVTAVKLYNKALYWKDRPRPRVGQVARLRLKNHVITDPFTDTIFCGLRARPIGRCGA